MDFSGKVVPMLLLERFLGCLAGAGALSMGALGLAGCGPEYDHFVHVTLSSKTDVSVDVADVPVSLQTYVSIVCTSHDPAGDPVPCGTEYPAITGLRVGPRGAEEPVADDGVLQGYSGGTMNLVVETAGRTYEREVVFPSVHTFTVEPDPPILTEPFMVRWTPHGQSGVSATIGIGSETEWTNSLADESDDGEELVKFDNLPENPGVYFLETERGNTCQYCDPVWLDEVDVRWLVHVSVVRTMEVTLPPSGQ